MRRLVAVEADHHANNRFGLMNPEVVLKAQDKNGKEEDYKPELAPVQEFLWELRTQNIEKLKDIARDDEIIYFHLGDPAQGWKHNGQFVSNTRFDELSITIENCRPIFELPNMSIARFVIGTEAHEGIGGNATRTLSRFLNSEYPNVDTKYLYHGVADVNGVTIDYTHHGPTTGIREWTKGNQLRHYLRSIMLTDMKQGKVPSKYHFRGHVHRLGWETVRIRQNQKWVTSDIMVVPSMCDIGAFARQITRSEHYVTNGMVVLEIIDGKLVDIHWNVITRDLRAREVL